MNVKSTCSNLTINGLKIFADREGDHVTGCVEFPYTVYGRTQCSINYHNVTSPPILGSATLVGGESGTDPVQTRAEKRLRVVNEYYERCNAREHCPGETKSKLQIAKDLAANTTDIKCNYRSVQAWVKKFEIEGIDGLRDNYVKQTHKVLSLDRSTARDAVSICAWWSFRIGNFDHNKNGHVINNKAISDVVDLLSHDFSVADILATIDCYYAAPIDRDKFPFKPFSKWLRYDFEKWLYRTCDYHDYRRAHAKVKDEKTPLFAPTRRHESNVPDTKTRKRDVNHRPTRQAIKKLSNTSSAVASPLVGGDPSGTDERPLTNREKLAGAKTLGRVGFKDAARVMTASVDTGIPAIAANRDPQSIADSLGVLPDNFRTMLLDAAHGDRDAIEQAIATIPMWWEKMPQTERNNIDFKVNAWAEDHSRDPDAPECRKRKVQMMLPKLRNHRSGAQRLGTAMRITA